MRFILRSLMGLFLLALTLGLLAYAGGTTLSAMKERAARSAGKSRATERVFTVNVLPADAGVQSPVIRAFGEIRAQRALDIRAPSGGTIIALTKNFVEGGRVEEGSLLLRLDPADAETAMAVATTDMGERQAELAEAKRALELARDEVVAAKAQADLRTAALTRQRDLLKRGVATEAAVETAALAASSADQAVLGKRQAEASAEARLNRSTTAVARQKIRLEEAKRNLADLEVFAEFSGTLSTVSVVEGGLVGPNEKLARLIDPAALEVAFRLSTSQYARLVAAGQGTPEMEVTARLELYGTTVEIAGRIERVSAEVGVGQTGRLVFARLDGTDVAALRPGDFVSVEVTEPPLENVVRLPATAVDAGGEILLLGDQDRLEIEQVRVLRRLDDFVLVRAEGLDGREVVEARSPLLGAGIKVKPVRRDAVIPKEQEMIELSDERRAKLMKFIDENDKLPDVVKERIIKRLQGDKVPLTIVDRIEARMGS